MTEIDRFDRKYYLDINEARWNAAADILKCLPDSVSCLDAGCGPGWFAGRLGDLGFKVSGFDGREDNLALARERVPGARFSVYNVEDASDMARQEPCDIVFCFGLIYHLENPFAAIRNLQRLCKKWMLVETQILPGTEPSFRLIAEGANATQGLNYHACVPSRSALVKTLYLSGFKAVERFTGKIDHPDFLDTPEKCHRREVFLAGYQPSGLADFEPEEEPSTPKIDYSCK